MCVAFSSKPHGGRCEFKGNQADKKSRSESFRFPRRTLAGDRSDRNWTKTTMPGSWNGKSTSWIEPSSIRCIAAVVRKLTIRW